MNETAKKRQSLPDLVIQECGGLEATMETARDNDLSPTDDLEAGGSLTFSQRVDAQSTAYYKAGNQKKEVQEVVEGLSKEEEHLQDMINKMPSNLTKEEKSAIAKNNVELEKALKIKKGENMDINMADKQHANPNLLKNDTFKRNCQTCCPAYMLRTRGFDIRAKGKTKGSLSEYLSWEGNVFKCWKEIDGTPAKYSQLKDWMDKKGLFVMDSKKYKEFFNDNCKEVGIYEFAVEWDSWKDKGHVVILQRFKEDGELRYIDTQWDNSEDGKYKSKLTMDSLTENAKKWRLGGQSGICRIDNKIFDVDYSRIFAK